MQNRTEGGIADRIGMRVSNMRSQMSRKHHILDENATYVYKCVL